MIYSYGDDMKFQDINSSFKDGYHTTFIDLQKPVAFLSKEQINERAQTTLPPVTVAVDKLTTLTQPATPKTVATATATIMTPSTTTTTTTTTMTTTTPTTESKPTPPGRPTISTTPAQPSTTTQPHNTTSPKCSTSCNCTSKNATVDGEPPPFFY